MARYFDLLSATIIQKIEKNLSTSKRVFPSYQGESTIFDKGNFLYHNPDSNNLLNLRELYLFVALFLFFHFTYCRPSGLQVCMHTIEVKNAYPFMCWGYSK